MSKIKKEFLYEGEVVIVGSNDWKETVLSTDPYEGDIGGGEILEDKIVKTRLTKKLCSDCFSICQPGTYSRVITSNEEGTLLSNRYCEECCTAMAYDELTPNYTQFDYYSDDEDEEEIMLSDVRREIRDKNEQLLINQLGSRYFEKTDEEKYSVILEHNKE